MQKFKFSNPETDEIDYWEIVPVYQAAFAGEPWFEVTKCVDEMDPKRCTGGLSPLSVGESCDVCELKPARPAYEAAELTQRFKSIEKTRKTMWYFERSGEVLGLAGLAWIADARRVAAEKYADVPTMKDWLLEQVGESDFIWLDEVFANRQVRPSGNLKNFGAMCLGFAERLNTDRLAYRTISPQMIAASKRDFGLLAKVFVRDEQVCDRRDFVEINLKDQL